MKNKGVALIFNLFLITVLLILGVAVSRMIYSTVSALFYSRDRLCAFHLAEAGVEYGKTKLAQNPAYSTPPLKQNLGEGYFVIEKAKNKPLLSSGHFRSARVIIKYDNAIHHYSNL